MTSMRATFLEGCRHIRQRGFTQIIQVIRGRYALRRCTSVGSMPRVEGPLIIVNNGTMRLGDRLRFRSTQVPIELATMPGGTLSIGSRTGINSGASICAQKSVTIGENCLIGNYCLIMDSDFHDAADRNKMSEAKPVCIEDNVWLAARVTVLKGVTIGEGAVVSAGSVVALDVPAYSVVGGVPARVIRRLTRPDEQPLAAAL